MKLHESLCYRVVPTVFLLNVWKQRRKPISHPDLTLFDVGDLGSRSETHTEDLTQFSSRNGEVFFEEIPLLYLEENRVKAIKSAVNASYSYQLYQHNEIIVNHRLHDEVLQQLGYRKKSAINTVPSVALCLHGLPSYY